MALKLQKKLLTQLEQYGDSFLDEKDYQRRRKKARPQTTITSHSSAGPVTTTEHDIKMSRKQKKKLKRKKMAMEDKEAMEGDDLLDAFDREDASRLTSHEKQLLRFKQDLGLTEEDFRTMKAKDNEKEIEITQSLTQAKKGGKKRPLPEVIVFEDPAKRKSKKLSVAQPKPHLESDTDQVQDMDEPKFDMKKARYDVQKFGIKGLEEGYKEQAMTSLLIKLGAKPPKREYVNYKMLQERKKSEKEARIEKRQIDRSLGYKVSSSGSSKQGKRSRDKNDVGFVDGQVGSYKRGVQVVSNKIIEKIKKSRGKGHKKVGATKGLKL